MINTKTITNLLLAEANAIRSLTANHYLLESIRDAATLISKSKPPLIVSGIGKSGHIARKIASTFCSLGHSAYFLHAAEASHGDMGLIAPDSVLLILSNSGETSELSDLLAYARENGHTIIGMTANENSTLGRLSHIPLAYKKQTEICRNNLAPTTSTTVALAIGDALAVTVSELKNIQPEDFRRYHPGGKLGSRLAKAGSFMKTGADLPIVKPNETMTNAFIEMSSKNLGVLLIEENNDITGIVTDGDLRRHAKTLFDKTVGDIATKNPFSIPPDTALEDAIKMMTKQKVTSCLIRDHSNAFLGFLHIHDCLKETK